MVTPATVGGVWSCVLMAAICPVPGCSGPGLLVPSGSHCLRRHHNYATSQTGKPRLTVHPHRDIETPRSRALEPLFCLLPQQWRTPGLLKRGPTGIALGFPSSHYGAAGTQEAPGRALDWKWGTGSGLGSALGHLWPPVPQLLQRRWASDVRGAEDGGPPMLDDRSGDRRPSGGPANLRPRPHC